MEDLFRFADELGPRKLVHLTDAAAGLRAVVAIDNVACGPAIGGVLIGAAGIGACFFINGMSYIAVITGLLAIRLPSPTTLAGRSSGWAGFRAGIRFIWGERRMRTLMVLVAVLSVFGFPVLVLMPVIARDVLHTDARGYGLLMAGVGVGVGVAAAIASSQLVASLLFETSPFDPVTFTLIPMLLLAVAGLAIYVPARRASRVDPVIALRSS